MQRRGLLEDDPEMLRVALALIDALDEDGDCAPPPPSPGIVPMCFPSEDRAGADENDDSHGTAHPTVDVETVNHTTARGPYRQTQSNPQLIDGTAPTANKPTTRKRGREEVIYLRDKMKELVATLSTLKAQVREQRSETAGGDLTTAVTQAWKEISIRQQRKRHDAELENAKLRAMLLSQVKVRKRLMRLFRRAVNEYEVGLPASFRLPRPFARMEPAFPTLSTCGHDIQLANLDAIYCRREALFTARQFHDGELEFRDVQLHCNDSSRQEFGMDFVIGWVLPFPVYDVVRAMGEVAATVVHSKEWTMTGREITKPSVDTAIARYQGSSPVKGFVFHGTFDGIVRTKCFHDSTNNEGTVIVTWYSTLTKGESTTIFTEECVSRIQKVANGINDSVTRIQTCRRVRVRMSTGITIPRRQAELFTTFFMGVVEREAAEKQAMTENLLLRTRDTVTR